MLSTWIKVNWSPNENSWLIGGKFCCWKRLKAEGDEGDRGWDGWMALPSQWIWAWTNSKRWWGTGKPGMLQSVGSQRIRHELQLNNNFFLLNTSHSFKFEMNERVAYAQFKSFVLFNIKFQTILTPFLTQSLPKEFNYFLLIFSLLNISNSS